MLAISWLAGSSCRHHDATPGKADIDALFHGYESKLPEASSESESNGFGLTCPKHGSPTYTLLDATARRLPLASDADLPRLVRWARHEDVCLRQIALDAIIAKVGYDPNRLAASSMHDPIHYQYHDILVSFRRYLDARGVVYDPTLFDGLMLSVRAEDFSALANGSWREQTNALATDERIIRIENREIVITTRSKNRDAARSDRSRTLEVTKIAVDANQAFVVTARERASAPDAGASGSAAPEHSYAFLPVAKDVVWFDGGSPGAWEKFVRGGG